MYSNETKDRFLELRSQGYSLAKIAADLNVSKRTLIDWNFELHHQIRQLRAVELEALCDKILTAREKELDWMVTFEEKIAKVLSKKDFCWIDSHLLLRYFLQYRGEIERVRSQVLEPLETAPPNQPPKTSELPPAPIPAREPPLAE